jgi:chemotaxis protein CheC
LIASPPRLNAIQLDALSELVNLGVSRAAKVLRDMVTREVVLSVPRVALVARNAALATLQEHGFNSFIAVHQNFEGPIAGRALLIFPDANSIELVRAVTGGQLSLDEVIEFEQEALAETGNVILNSCLATIANMLACSLKTSLPEVLRGSGEALFTNPAVSADEDLVLFLYITFSVQAHELNGYIALLMDIRSVISLVKLLDQFIERTTGVAVLESDGPN